MSYSAKELIKQRKSVRSFDGKGITEEDRRRLEDYIASLENPFGVPVTLRLLDAAEHRLSSPVIVGENTYLAGKVKRMGQYEIAFGYSLEKACIYALSLGIGMVMLAATLSRNTFEQAMDVKEDEVLPAASPVGYPAKKPSLREGMMRKAIKADERIAFCELFFDGDFEKKLTEEAAGDLREALEAVRWAPSAGNQQPWRAVTDSGRVHFYERRSMKESSLGDIQKVDLGIALAHFEMAMEEEGVFGRFVSDDPGIKMPERTEYIITYERMP